MLVNVLLLCIDSNFSNILSVFSFSSSGFGGFSLLSEYTYMHTHKQMNAIIKIIAVAMLFPFFPFEWKTFIQLYQK